MGLAWVQNDCKTKWIPNIWKNEETGGVTCKALAPADVWVPLRLPLELGASDGGEEGVSRRRGPQPCLSGDSCPGVNEKGLDSLSPNPRDLTASAEQTRAALACVRGKQYLKF